MTSRSTRKNLFALAALLGIGAGVAAWQERTPSDATPSGPKLAETPAEVFVDDPCPACGRGHVSDISHQFLDAYTTEDTGK